MNITSNWFPGALKAVTLQRFTDLLTPESDLRKSLLGDLGMHLLFCDIDESDATDTIHKTTLRDAITKSLSSLSRKEKTCLSGLTEKPAKIGQNLAKYDFNKPLEKQSKQPSGQALKDLIDIAGTIALFNSMPDHVKTTYRATIQNFEKILLEILKGFKKASISQSSNLVGSC